jgi:hypothetical protein
VRSGEIGSRLAPEDQDGRGKRGTIHHSPCMGRSIHTPPFPSQKLILIYFEGIDHPLRQIAFNYVLVLGAVPLKAVLGVLCDNRTWNGNCIDKAEGTIEIPPVLRSFVCDIPYARRLKETPDLAPLMTVFSACKTDRRLQHFWNVQGRLFTSARLKVRSTPPLGLCAAPSNSCSNHSSVTGEKGVS